MKKYLLVLIIVLVFSSLAFGQDDISFTKMGLRGSGGSSDYEGMIGETISVSFDYSYTDVDNPNNAYNNTGSGNVDDEIVVLWYSGSSWSNASFGGFDDGISVSNFESYGSSGTGDGSYDFTLPSAPTGGNTITYFQIFFGLKAPDGFSPPFYGDLNTSGADFSGFTAVNDAPTGYYTYMEFVNDTTTEAPTLDLPLASSTIGKSFSFQYDQPETAYGGSVKITFTQSGGTADPDSPHVLEVLSEAIGTDISFTLRGDDLGLALEVILDDGGNSLVDGSEYTVKIEYQDLAQNSPASDQNSGVQYESDEAILATGGDYNAGASFAPGSTNNAYFWLRLVKNTSGTALPVDDIDFDTTGGMVATDIDNIKIWHSTDNSFNSSSDTHLLTISSGFDPLVFDFSPDEDIGEGGSYYFLTIDVSSSASGSDAIGAQIEYASDIDAYSAAVLGTFPITGGEHPLPVTMSSFTAQFTNGTPTLYWTTQSETDNMGWNIYRGTSQNMGQTILVNAGGLIPGQGTTSEPTDYVYTDHNGVVENTTYYYWLESVEYGGETEMFGPISLTIPLGGGNSGTPAAPDDYGLQQNYPNPFNPSTEIRFALEESSNAILTIYNTKGQQIQTLFKGNVPADIVKSVVWNGRDNSGKQVASGIYLYELKTNKETYIRKMILTK